MTRVFLSPSAIMSQAMFRIARALFAHAPDNVEIVRDEASADVVVLHTIGYPETVEALDRCEERRQRAVIAQYCLISTQRPDPRDWLPLWRRASLVWSYYDLFKLSGATDFGFLRTPLGVNAEVFDRPLGGLRPFNILTSGYVAESECVGEAVEAADRVGGNVCHLGPDNVLPSGQTGHVTFVHGIPDRLLAGFYGHSQFVAGLRRGEGFELPAAEGLLCGARPIMFDQPHYRDWFDDFAEFIPEGSYAEVTNDLEALFLQGPRPVTPQERLSAASIFCWSDIAGAFWREVLK